MHMQEREQHTFFLRSIATFLIIPLVLATSFSFPRSARADIGLIISLIVLATATSVTIDATTCYFNQIWACSDATGGTTTVINLPPVPVTLSADPNPIDRGQSTTLTWNGTNATACQAAGNGAWLPAGSPASGSLPVGPFTSDQSYQVSCSNSVGSTDSNIVTITVRQPTATIEAIPDRIVVNDTNGTGAGTGSGGSGGGSTTVSWNATNVNSCTITKNGVVWQTLTADSSRTVSGSASTPITTQTTFVINCTNNTSSNAVAASARKIVNLVTSFEEF